MVTALAATECSVHVSFVACAVFPPCRALRTVGLTLLCLSCLLWWAEVHPSRLCSPVPSHCYLLSLLVLSLLSSVRKVQVTDPKNSAGGFCFSVDKAQDNFHRVGNLVWEKKLFIDRKRSDLKQQQKKLLLLF